MADEEHEHDHEHDQEHRPKTTQEAAQRAALDRVTDQSEEKEIKAVDTSQIQKAMAALVSQQRAAREANKQREKELAAVKVASQDIDFLALEFELDKKKAERALREHKGDLRETILSMVHDK